MSEAQTWSHDRMHASPLGHQLFAEAAAQALRLPGSNDGWTTATGDTDDGGFWRRVYAQIQWSHGLLIPWLWRHLRGRSSGDGRDPKYPALQPVTGTIRLAQHTA